MKTCKMGCGKMKSGGAATKPIKKMKSGGSAKLKDIINKNFPMSGTTGPISMKKGGGIKKMQPGGATGPNPNPTGKKPFEDILGAAAGIAGILGASSYFNSDKAAARQKARLEKRDERKEARQTARDLAKSKRREEKGFKPISGPSFKKGGSVKAKKFAALAPPYDKATAADRIAGAKKNARKKR